MEEIKFLKTVRQENTQLKIYIPTEVAQALNLKRGDLVQVSLTKVKEASR